MKRLIVCCDGTWQSQNNKVPTNVFKIAQAVKSTAKKKQGEVAQVLYYDPGIGTIESKESKQSWLKSAIDTLKKIGGGAFGWWIDEKIESAYIFLCLNYLPGDEIYLFGFSRGAYTVRSLAGLINCCGLLKRPDINKTAEAYRIYRLREQKQRQQEASDFCDSSQTQRVELKFLGCWDTVGALGLPDLIPWLTIDKIFKQKYKFHDFELSPMIQNARHAIALDETKPAFEVAIMKAGANFNGTLKQVWFPGDHGCVGGGTAETLGLSNAALKWMADEASQLGLDLNLNLAEDTERIDSTTPFKSPTIGEIVIKKIVGSKDRDLTKLNNQLTNQFQFDLDNSFHLSVKERWCDRNLNYQPKSIAEFINNKPHNWCGSKVSHRQPRSSVSLIDSQHPNKTS